jgi:cytochrome c peroxidase
MWQKNFLWDGGILNLELVAVNAITSPVEMDENLPNIVEKLKRSKVYPNMFKEAFGSEEITSTKMLVAIGHFMALFISDKSKYDEVKRGKAQFTEQEQRGYNLFKQHCETCHKEPLFTDESFRNNGVQHFFSIDKGRYEISLLEGDEGKFKVPSLRNVELTAPYMHDGRFPTLMDVLNHYSEGIQNYPNLDPLLINKIPLNTQEKEDIIAFLKTLTDKSFIQNKRFSEF